MSPLGHWTPASKESAEGEAEDAERLVELSLANKIGQKLGGERFDGVVSGFCRVGGFRLQASGSGLGILGLGCRVSGRGFR